MGILNILWHISVNKLPTDIREALEVSELGVPNPIHSWALCIPKGVNSYYGVATYSSTCIHLYLSVVSLNIYGKAKRIPGKYQTIDL